MSNHKYRRHRHPKITITIIVVIIIFFFRLGMQYTHHHKNNIKSEFRVAKVADNCTKMIEKAIDIKEKETDKDDRQIKDKTMKYQLPVLQKRTRK